MAGAVTGVRGPDRCVPLGSRHLARAAAVRLPATGPGWDRTAVVGCKRAAAACSDR
jgi:hypothetical protein